jgi:hypothetical protein
MEQLNKKQLRALDLMIKSLSKRYPFIVGWEPSEDFLRYDTMLNIDFKVDIDKLAKFFNAETDESWKRIIQDEGGSYPAYTLGGLFNYDKYPHIKDLSYDTSENIERILTDINEELPEDIRMTYPFENFRGETVNVPRRIRRDHYVMQ